MGLSVEEAAFSDRVGSFDFEVEVGSNCPTGLQAPKAHYVCHACSSPSYWAIFRGGLGGTGAMSTVDKKKPIPTYRYIHLNNPI